MNRVVFALTLVACGPGVKGGPSMNSKIGATAYVAPLSSSVLSEDILKREPVANTAEVKHILVSWEDLHDAFQGHQDERGAKRTMKDAEVQVKTLLTQLREGGDFDTLMKEFSEDKGSAQSGRPFTVTPDAQLVIEFRQLALRLNVGEFGVCQSDFGFHIIKRLQ
jgi:parvulin-like peptidyl-prolyl isomerase